MHACSERVPENGEYVWEQFEEVDFVMDIREGQTWKHRDYGREFVVIERNASTVRLESKGEPKTRLRMQVAQLEHHYEYVEG